MRCTAAVLTILLAGCGRLGFGETTGVTDATVDAASDATPRCDPATPFGAPQLVNGVNGPTYDSTFTPLPGELTAVFYSDRTGGYDIYMATRATTADAWTVAPAVGLNSAATDKEPVFLPDQSGLAFASTRAPADALGDLWFATYDGSAFSVVGLIANLNSTAVDYHPYFRDGSNEFYFSSQRSGSFKIYRSTYLGGGAFSDPVAMPDVDVAGSDSEVAIVSEDGLVMYFRSNRPGGLGAIDIYVATRATTADTFGNATNVVELNSVALDTPNWISPDLCTIYLSSSRNADPSQIYVATRPLP